MYQLYVMDESAFDTKKFIGEFGNVDNARTRLEKELAKDKDVKYIIEQTTGQVNSYGDLTAIVIEEN